METKIKILIALFSIVISVGIWSGSVLFLTYLFALFFLAALFSLGGLMVDVIIWIQERYRWKKSVHGEIEEITNHE